MITTGEWLQTDASTEQYGREISEFIWEYKQPDINEGDPVVIDITQYTIGQIEDCIRSYGYTLGSNGNHNHNIWQEYQLNALQIMCECLYEMGEKPKIQHY